MRRIDLLKTSASGWTILVRLLVGLVVFLPEGIQKLAFADILGAGRFARIGIPLAGLMGPFVGIVEIACSTLVMVGLLTRLASIPLIVVMVVAMEALASRIKELDRQTVSFHPPSNLFQLCPLVLTNRPFR